MVRILFLAAPFKIKLYNNLKQYFPEEFDFRVTSAVTHPRALRAHARQSFQEIVNTKPDIVITDFPAYPSWLSRLYSFTSGRRIPLLIWLLGDFWREYFSILPTLQFKQHIYHLFNFFFWSTGFRFSECIMPVCKWLEKIVNKRIPEIPTEVLYQGSDSSLFSDPPKDRFEFKKPAVGILQDNNIWLKTQGLIWFQNVAKQMKDVNFYIAGGGIYTQQVKKVYSELDNVHFIDKVSYPQGVKKFHASCDLYLLTSGLDCCPTSLLEASLCKKAVIASRIGGVPELVVEDKTGWTIPNGKEEQWKEKIYFLINHPAFSKRMGENGRKFVLKNFDWKVQIDILTKNILTNLEII